MREEANALVQLRQRVQDGSLTPDEVVRRLQGIIEAEYDKPDADTGLIHSCESLLREITAPDAAPAESGQYAQQICQHVQRTSARNLLIRYAAAAAACLLVIALIGGIRFRWYDRLNISDEEHYTIMGRELSVEMVQKAYAEAGMKNIQLSTRDLAEVEAALGFVPAFPPGELLDAKDVLYSVNVFREDSVDLCVWYGDAQGKGIAVFSNTYYLNMEWAYASFEQSREGETVDVDGVQVYCSDNIARRLYVWTEGQTIYSLGGFLDDETAFRCVREVMGIE